MKTIEEFNKSRAAKMIEGGLMILRGIKKLSNKYAAHRQRQADKRVQFYIKDNSDFERYQRAAIYYAHSSQG